MSGGIDRDRWQRVSPVLDAVLAQEPARWAEALELACGGDRELHDTVKALLERAAEARGLLATPPTAVAAAAIDESEDAVPMAPGRRIGAYGIVREIGRGGMARVFLARRVDGEFDRLVALKLLRPGLDSDVDRARFRAERQILATLNHPNIARLFDGGIVDSGQPFLVLEHVEGEPIDAYCEGHGLTVGQRLELFLLAAGAVQYAHRNLVVHRDIKPSNLLVSADGAVKLLDFGVAKLLDPSIDGRMVASMPTVAHWMTPEFAAPEQIRQEAVTTLTDVYQLGVLLYRLLSGGLPFTAPAGQLAELQAAVLRGDPDPPSAAAARADSVRARELRGDLDAIVLKAMHADPADRYASVESLAADLRRYLSGHPVRARRAGAFYQARRFVRRNRVETAAALAILLSILAGAGLSLHLARRAAAERDAAAAATRNAQAVTAFVTGLFEVSDPSEVRGDTLSAKDLVRRAAARAELLAGDPIGQARMLEVTARLDQGLGDYSAAYALLERALALRRRASAGDSLAVVGTLARLGDVLVRLRRYAAADSVAREALRTQERLLGPEHASLGATHTLLGYIASYRGLLSEADAQYRRALGIRLRALGPNDTLTAESRITLGGSLREQGRIAEAESEFRSGLAIMSRSAGPGSLATAGAELQLAYLLDEDEQRFAEALPLYEQALAIRRRELGAAHPTVGATLLDLAEFLRRRGAPDSSLVVARQGAAIELRAFGAEHPAAVTANGRLAAILHHAGRLDEADSLFRVVIATARRVRSAGDDDVAGLEVDHARLLIDRNEYAAAESELRDAIRIRAPNKSPALATTQGLLGVIRMRQGRYAVADSILRDALTTVEHQVSRAQPNVREVHGWLADVEDAEGRGAEARRDRAIANTVVRPGP